MIKVARDVEGGDEGSSGNVVVITAQHCDCIFYVHFIAVLKGLPGEWSRQGSTYCQWESKVVRPL
jgi:hypothetical protein